MKRVLFAPVAEDPLILVGPPSVATSGITSSISSILAPSLTTIGLVCTPVVSIVRPVVHGR